MTALEETADRQAVWSATASKLKQGIDLVRWMTFVFSILGALTATVASQMPEGELRLTIAIFGAALLGVVSFLSARLLNPGHISAWVRARAASEALKRQAFVYAAEATPYDNPATRDGLLNSERGQIETAMDDMLDRAVTATGSGSAPRSVLTREKYLDQRVRGQVTGFYEPKAENARRTAQRLRWIEFGLSLAATVLTAVVGLAGKKPFGIPFDFVALTAVLTTVGGAVLAHIEASRLDYIVTTYRATARRLRDVAGNTTDQDATTISSPDWSALVQNCENVISQENANWIAKWSKA